MIQFFLLLLIAFARIEERCHDHGKDKRFVKHIPKQLKNSPPAHGISETTRQPDFQIPQIDFSPKNPSGDSVTVTVSWKNVGYPSDTDWVGVYAGNEGKSLRDWGVPIMFRDICGVVNCGGYRVPSHGNMTFELLNIRAPYRFVYWGGEVPYFAAQAVSEDAMSFQSHVLPMHVHIAVSPAASPTTTTMYIMWVQKNYTNPAVYYGEWSNNLDKIGFAKMKQRIDRTDFCDQLGPAAPASGEGFFDLGSMITSEIVVDNGVTYYYRVGEPNNGYSEVYSFVAPKSAGQPVTMIAFGDMGQAPGDGIQEQSWDNKNHGEIGSLDTIGSLNAMLEQDPNAFDLLLHFGDISYATGYLAEWDEFMHLIAPIARTIPYMTGIGNHEFGHTQSFNPSTDSGGECGVPYNFYFPFASTGLSDALTEKKPWYSFNYGNVHVTQISTEHDFQTESEQLAWLADDLSSVNRTATPWVVLTAHRPLYIDSSWSGDKNMSDWLISHVEPLMVKHKVNMGFYGHYHAYQRSCAAVKGVCQPDGDAPMHFVLGMAGYQLTKQSPINPAQWALFRDQTHFGYAKVKFHDDRTAQLDFINASPKQEVLDTVKITNYALS